MFQQQPSYQFNQTSYFKWSYNSNGLKPEEVFVHRTSILSPNNLFEAALNKGEEVEYELHDGPRGIFALYVTGPKGRPVQLSAYGNNYLLQHQERQQQQNYQTKSAIGYQPLYAHPQQQYMTYVMPSHNLSYY
ncbi:hypothetical protein BDF21DRAFT_397508 [Thamnidium elegans]|nr:hypothetical protein BDF21DRAFT_397508 [Thamnidium elegans]